MRRRASPLAGANRLRSIMPFPRQLPTRRSAAPRRAIAPERFPSTSSNALFAPRFPTGRYYRTATHDLEPSATANGGQAGASVFYPASSPKYESSDIAGSCALQRVTIDALPQGLRAELGEVAA